MPWYAVQTKPTKEHSVEAALEQAGVEVYCPRIRRPNRDRSPRTLHEIALFPGYLFARFDFDREYPRLRWTRGLVRVVMSGATPLAITPETLAAVRQIEKEEARGVVRVARWKSGTRVRVVQGPFSGLEGRIATIHKSGERVRVLLELFRRQSALECDAHLLQPLASAGGL